MRRKIAGLFLLYTIQNFTTGVIQWRSDEAALVVMAISRDRLQRAYTTAFIVTSGGAAAAAGAGKSGR